MHRFLKILGIVVGTFFLCLSGILLWLQWSFDNAGEDLFGYVNSQGQFVILPKFKWAGPFKEGLAEVWTEQYVKNKYQMFSHKIDVHGKYWSTAIINEGDDLSDPNEKSDDFEHHLQFEKKNGFLPKQNLGTGLWGYINEKGDWSIAPKYYQESNFINGKAYVLVGNMDLTTQGRWGIINQKGEYVLRPMCKYISNFHDGLAVCRVHLVRHKIVTSDR